MRIESLHSLVLHSEIVTGADLSDWVLFGACVGSIVLSAWVGRRGLWPQLLGVAAVLLGASLVVTGVLRLVPGDPVDLILGEQATQQARVQLAQDLGLMHASGKSTGFVAQYAHFVRGMFDGSLVSYHTRQPVFITIAHRFPYTARLAGTAMVLAVAIGIPLGIVAAMAKHSWIDALATGFAVLGVSVPRLCLGPLLLLLFAVQLHWLPVSGAQEGWRSLVLPAASLGTAMAAALARLTRAALLEVLQQDYILCALAKGLSPWRILFVHALPNALIPVITVMGLQCGALLAGAVVTEQIFNWPGIGMLLFESIQQLDMPMVQGVVMVIACSYVFINLAVDLLCQWADPRLRLETVPEE